MSRLDRIVEKMPFVAPKEGTPNVFRVERDHFVRAIEMLKEDPDLAFTALLDVTAVEYPEEMCGVYFLMNLNDMQCIHLEVPFSKDSLHLPTISHLFSAANVLERETYDFFGIIYDNHPDLRRVLCPDDFVGHPLRKDYVSHTRD